MIISSKDIEIIEKKKPVAEIVQIVLFKKERIAADKILKISLNDKVNCLVLRMRSVSAIDATAMHNLEQLLESCKKLNIQLVLSHVNEQPMKVMKKAGFVEKVGAENFCSHIDEALKRATELAA